MTSDSGGWVGGAGEDEGSRCCWGLVFGLRITSTVSYC